jgi:Flp pilus assembly protein TadG
MTARWLCKFVLCRQGNIALSFALLAPMLIGLTGGAIDMGSFMVHKDELQSAADAAALAAAKEGGLSGWSESSAKAVVESYIDANVRNSVSGEFTAQVDVDAQAKQVTVTLEQDHRGYFVIGYFQGSPQIRVMSTAQASNNSNICVIGLHDSDAGTVSMDTNAMLSAPDCAVYSNSVSQIGLQSVGNAMLVSDLTCSTGGFSGATKNFDKLPLTDCPPVSDPLSSRPSPPVGACKERDAVYQNFTGTLSPGVYCGGLTIRSSSNVILKPGVYVMKDGPFVVQSASQVDGAGVGIYFTGSDASFVFESSSVVNIEAPKDGPLAGLIFFQDRQSAEADFVITSNKARNLLGTVYLPNGNLIVDANNKVADASAYTAVVVNRLKLSKGPNLVLNTDYDSTLVPVPEGVGPQGTTVKLVK